MIRRVTLPKLFEKQFTFLQMFRRMCEVLYMKQTKVYSLCKIVQQAKSVLERCLTMTSDACFGSIGLCVEGFRTCTVPLVSQNRTIVKLSQFPIYTQQSTCIWLKQVCVHVQGISRKEIRIEIFCFTTLFGCPNLIHNYVQSNLDISKLMGLFITSSHYPKCKLICTSVNLDL